MATGSTLNYNIPYPISTDPVNVASDIQDLADSLDTFFTNPSFINSIDIDGGSVTTTALTGNIFNTNATTLNIGGAATTINLGANNGIVYYRGDILPDTDNTGVVGNATYTWSNGQFTNMTVDGTLTVRTAIDLADSDILQFGTSDDVKISYDGTNNTLDIELESTASSLNITDNGTDKVIVTRSSGNISTVGQLISTVANGTAPLSVSSTTLVSNLNSDLLDGQEGSYYLSLANVTGTLAAANGGTGQSSYTVGDILYASGASALSKLAGVATGNALISGGVGIAPSWGKIDLTTHISGTLAVANGGTGVTTSTGSGSVVLSTSPTLTTPNIGAATGTTLSLTGSTITMESATSGTPTDNVSFIVERGTDPNVEIRWNETGDAWQFTNDGTTYYDIPISTGGDTGLEAVLMFAGM